MKLLVVGAGVAGSCVARKARDAGMDVTVMAAEGRHPASFAALCVAKASWFARPGRWRVQEAARFYTGLGAITTTTADYTSYRKAGTEKRDGFLAIDPGKVLVEADITGLWPERPAGYDAVALCLGAHAEVGWPRTCGETTVIDYDGEPVLRAHLDAPRRLIFAVSHDGRSMRFGSSVANTPERAHQGQMKLVDRALLAGLLPYTGLSRGSHRGVRLNPPIGHEHAPISHCDDVWEMHGFGRVGFSLAPSRADELLQEILR